MLKFTLSLLCIWLAFFSPRGVSGNEYVNFDGSVCEIETNGKITIRLETGLAFQFPADFLVPIMDEHHKPTDPNFDTLGCPENPAILDGIAIRSRGLDLGAYDAEKGRYVWKGPSIEYIRIISGDRPPILQLSHLKAFERVRASGGFCEEFDGVLTRCFSDGAGESPIGYLSVLDGKYEEFDGLPIAGSCRLGIGGDFFRCSLHYQLEKGLTISWSLNTMGNSEDQIIK